MSPTLPAGRFRSITAGARLFALIVLAPPVAFSGDSQAILSTILVAAVWMGATFAGGLPGYQPRPALVLEAALVAFLLSGPLSSTGVLVPALVIPPFIAGTYLGVRGALQILLVEVVVLAAAITLDPGIHVGPDLLALLFTWVMAALGFGLIGAVIRAAHMELGDTTRSSYRDARALLTQLLELSDDLIGGLDPVSISKHIIDLAREEIPLSGVVVHARMPSGAVSVMDGDGPVDEGVDVALLVDRVFEHGKPEREGSTVAIPVKTDAGMVAVLTADLAPGIDPEHISLDKAMASVAEAFRPEALKLDTALVFSAVREAATSEERQRLAREMHDGVAQDLASFGYLIDDAAAEAESEGQRGRLMELRHELTGVVGELRRSVFSLRNEAAGERTLGERIAIMAEHLEGRFGVRVEVAVNEADGRLRPEVENELLRIAQEGMNNAVKHAKASIIRVRCVVRVPHCQIRVLDDGIGLHGGRDDSHGVRIMRERAHRIGADLQLTDTGAGTLLQVTLGTPDTRPVTDAAVPLERSNLA